MAHSTAQPRPSPPFIPHVPYSPDLEKPFHPPGPPPYGAFDESHIPLIVGRHPLDLESGPNCRHAERKRASGGVRKMCDALLLLCFFSLYFFIFFGDRLSFFGAAGVGRCEEGRKWYHLDADAKILQAQYHHSTDSPDDLRPPFTHPTSANASFFLDLRKTLRVIVPDGVEGEIVVSRQMLGLVDAQMILETFREGDGEVLGCTGMWSDERSDSLYLEPSDSGMYHRVHLILAEDPAIPVPALYTNLPIRLSPQLLHPITFTTLGLQAHKPDQDISGTFNISDSIMFQTDQGKIDVDVRVVPTHNDHASSPSLPRIEAQSNSGSVSIRVHPADPADVFAHPTKNDAQTNSGRIAITDPTFLGEFKVGAERGEARVEVGEGEGKEVRVRRGWGGYKVGEVRLKGREREGTSVVRAMSARGDVELML